MTTDRFHYRAALLIVTAVLICASGLPLHSALPAHAASAPGVWIWGTGNLASPTQVQGLGPVAAVGGNLVVQNDGTVWQLRTGGSQPPMATPVSGLSGVIAVAAGVSGHSLALKSDGTVWAWGIHNYGAIGNGPTPDPTPCAQFIDCVRVPVQAVGLTDVVAIAAGAAHSLALKRDGTVWAWGLNNAGQLGSTTPPRCSISRSGLIPCSYVPIQVPGLSGVISLAGGGNHSLALRSDSTVWAWGSNDYGQLGDGTLTQRTTPGPVSGLSGIKAIAAGDFHNLALKADRTLVAWGSNQFGQLSAQSPMCTFVSCSKLPIPVAGLSGITAIAAGSNHSITLGSDGIVRTWGDNSSGQLGTGSSDTAMHLTPAPLSGLSGVTAITAVGNISMAIVGQAPGAKDDCRDGGYGRFTDPATGQPFSNQGTCISFMERQSDK
jgi:alpha-tubulin suppressor-like RCC1 family protein